MPVRQVPLFPLPQCVFFPSALLPLHVFEPRYRDMMDLIADQLPNARLLAIALLADGYEDTYDTLQAPIHTTLTIGRVVEHTRLADGRYTLLVRGLCRGRVISEDRSRCFRMAQVETLVNDPLGGRLEPSQLPELESILKWVIQTDTRDASVVHAIIEASRTNEELIDLLAFNLLSSDHTVEKQRMLDEPSVQQRCCMLMGALRDVVSAHADDHSSTSAGDARPPTTLN